MKMRLRLRRNWHGWQIPERVNMPKTFITSYSIQTHLIGREGGGYGKDFQMLVLWILKGGNNMAQEKIRLGIVVSEYNYDITSMMLERAQQHAQFLGAEVTKVVEVPGVFDMGLAIKNLVSRKDIDGVVALGAVIEGETDHDEIVIQHASRKIADLSIEYGKPIGLGITGPGMSRLQAEKRIDRAKHAVESVVKLYKKMAKL
jgi:6,7-dimethyl-8-ribityllumazine synthase